MTKGLTVTKQVCFRTASRGRKVMGERVAAKAPDLGSVPRISRLMALAIHMDDLIRHGEVADYAELARLAHVTRARMTQIMSLLNLAPEIQEEILWLPRSGGGRDAIREKMLRPIAAVAEWGRQRGIWEQMDNQRGPARSVKTGMSTNKRSRSRRTPVSLDSINGPARC